MTATSSIFRGLVFCWAASISALAGAEKMLPPGTAKLPVETPLALAAPVCPATGYLSYVYPGFDVCPCGSDGCFHPSRYYCTCGQYEKQWFRHWLRVQFGHGSMLDVYPCHCIFPPTVRPVIPIPVGAVSPMITPTEPQVSP